MVDTESLSTRIKKSGKSKEEICAIMGISIGSLNNKLAGRTSFTVPEAKSIQRILKIDNADMIKIFFNNKSSKIESLEKANA